MTKEEKTMTTFLMGVVVAFFIGVAIATVLVNQDVKTAEYRYEQLEEQYNQLADRHWNLQQDYLKLKKQ